jgi:hypothetical protein
MSQLYITESPSVANYRRGVKRNRSIDRAPLPDVRERDVKTAGITSQQLSGRRLRRNLVENEADLSKISGTSFDAEELESSETTAVESGVTGECKTVDANLGSKCLTNSNLDNLKDGNYICSISDVCESNTKATTRKRSARLDKNSSIICDSVQQTSLQPGSRDSNKLDSDSVEKPRRKSSGKRIGSAQDCRNKSGDAARETKSKNCSGVQESKKALLIVDRIDINEKENHAHKEVHVSQQESGDNDFQDDGGQSSSVNNGTVNSASEAVAVKVRIFSITNLLLLISYIYTRFIVTKLKLK